MLGTQTSLMEKKIEELANAKLRCFRWMELEGGRAAVAKKEGVGKKKRKRAPPRYEWTPLVVNEMTEGLKALIENQLNGRELKVLIQKHVYEWDTISGQNRLSMPVKQLETNDFLREGEIRTLRKDPKADIDVWLLCGPTLEVYPMKLSLWSMTRTYNYVLKKNWHHFWYANKDLFPEGQKIQVWSFRTSGDRLCLAILPVGPTIRIEAQQQHHHNDHQVAAAT